MTNQYAKYNGLNEVSTNSTQLDIPIDLTDLLKICKNYSKLGFGIQQQIEYITDNGVEEAINSGNVKVEALPIIRDFLEQITDNMLGDAVDQCFAVIMMIDNYEMRHPKMNGTTN